MAETILSSFQGTTGDITLIVVLLVAACAFFLVEICTPSFGVLAFLGLVSLGGAIFAAFRLNYILGLFFSPDKKDKLPFRGYLH